MKKETRLEDFFKKNDDIITEKIEKSTENSKKLNNNLNEIDGENKPVKKRWFKQTLDFFKNISIKNFSFKKKRDNNKKQILKTNRKFKFKLRNFYSKVKSFAVDRFSFEAGIDILDDTSVLYRRNIVIKNITLVTNAVFLLFTLIGSEESNIIVTLGFALVMYSINATLKKLIYDEQRTLLKQQIAMYISSVYILLASIAVYIKLVVSAGSNPPFEVFSITQGGYILIYFALVVLSLFQDSKLLRILFKWVLIIVTIIHVTILYPLYENGTFSEITTYLFVDNVDIFKDIILRTLILIIFMIALYSTVSITEMMNNKRKEELIKRRGMESDFKAVVNDVFDVISVFNSTNKFDNENQAARIGEMSRRLGGVLGYSNQQCKEIYDYSVIHIDKLNNLSLAEYDDKEVLDEKDFGLIREKTIVGSVIIKRLQLNQKAEDIVRAHFEKNADEEFINDMNSIQKSNEGQIILLSEMYDILRTNRNYKKKLKHNRAVDLIKLEFNVYFDTHIIDRFVRYADEFEDFYNMFNKR